jgi:hypothetical protein
MKSKLMMSLLVLACAFVSQAQTADEILDKYFENTGGKAKWEAVQGLKYTAKLKFGAVELPMTMIQLKDGRQTSSISVQGMEIRDGVFDGTTLWGTNQMTMKPEKSDAEATANYKVNAGGDFPSPFLDYKKKGYKVELLGKETVDGSETFKIKLTKKPIKVDGKETENVEFHYFDTENFVPLIVENEVKSGPGKGAVLQNKLSDYQDAGGFLFPFSISIGAKGQPGGQNLVYTAVELNPKVEASAFAFPEGK